MKNFLLATLVIITLNSNICLAQKIDSLFFGKDKYVGNVKNNKPNGQGTYYYANGVTKYIGNFEDGEYEGQGNIIWKSGASYEGQWKKSKMHGKGIYKYSNGAIYTGDFKDDKCSGKGFIKYSDGITYDGDWENDERNGKGVVVNTNGYYKNGSFKNDLPVDVKYYNPQNDEVSYEEYNGNQKSGLQTLLFGEEKYIGNVENYKMNGQGKYFYKNGAIYEGNFKDGKYYGQGTFTYANGEIYTGEFEDDKCNGEGKITKPNGCYYTAKFKNDEPKNAKYFTKSGNETTYYLWKIEVDRDNPSNSNITPGGVQYSYADMSEFTNKKGVMTIINETGKMVYAFNIICSHEINESAVASCAGRFLGSARRPGAAIE